MNDIPELSYSGFVNEVYTSKKICVSKFKYLRLNLYTDADISINFKWTVYADLNDGIESEIQIHANKWESHKVDVIANFVQVSAVVNDATTGIATNFVIHVSGQPLSTLENILKKRRGSREVHFNPSAQQAKEHGDNIALEENFNLELEKVKSARSSGPPKLSPPPSDDSPAPSPKKCILRNFVVKKKSPQVAPINTCDKCKMLPDLILPGNMLMCKQANKLDILPSPAINEPCVLVINNKVLSWLPINNWNI